MRNNDRALGARRVLDWVKCRSELRNSPRPPIQGARSWIRIPSFWPAAEGEVAPAQLRIVQPLAGLAKPFPGPEILGPHADLVENVARIIGHAHVQEPGQQ